ncbi:DUF397 domain-containing protein [Streptomyces abikoensis]|uniref:DUF397 domain-containing protein n=1 Tax=Streptomyces abikoensis TaxID=97398 RepID=UPI003407D3E4
MTHRTRIAPDIAPETAWFKSSHSQENGTACVEVANLAHAGHVGVRDSKDKTGPALLVTTSAWTFFVTEVRSGTPGFLTN